MKKPELSPYNTDWLSKELVRGAFETNLHILSEHLAYESEEDWDDAPGWPFTLAKHLPLLVRNRIRESVRRQQALNDYLRDKSFEALAPHISLEIARNLLSIQEEAARVLSAAPDELVEDFILESGPNGVRGAWFYDLKQSECRGLNDGFKPGR